MVRTPFLSRPALALALALGTVAGAGMVATPALAAKEKAAKEKPAAGPKISPTKAFGPVYQNVAKLLGEARKRPDVIAQQAKVNEAKLAFNATTTRSARNAAGVKLNEQVAALTTLLGAEAAAVDDAFAKVASPDDKYLAGQLSLDLGRITNDMRQQRRGIVAVAESGKLAPADAAKYQVIAGGISYDLKDHAEAIRLLSAGIAAGYPELDARTLLAEAQFASGQKDVGLATLKKLVNDEIAAGRAPQGPWLERGVEMAYIAKQPTEAMNWAILRLGYAPTEFNWISAVQLTREGQRYSSAEAIDLSRLLNKVGALRTNSQSVQREYVEYLQAAVGRAGVLFPGEVAKIANQGVAVGALQKSDVFVSDALNSANSRLAADKASLPGLERDARAAAATAKTATIAADTFLSYETYDKAADLYTLALTKPGVDAGTVQLRLGIALMGLGRNADALAAFAKVEGPRKPLAQLWSLYAQGKVVA